MNILSRVSRAILASFRRWVHAQDAQEVLPATTLGSWLSLGVVVPLLLAVIAWAPGARTFFNLSFPAAMLCFLPTFVLGVGFALLHRRRQRIEGWGWLWLVPGTASLQFFIASLAALSSMPGATVFAAPLLFSAAFHGRLHRVTPSQPFLALGTAVAVGLATLLRRSEEHLALFAVIGPAAVMAELYLGVFALKHDRARLEAEKLRTTVQAQLLDRQERDVGRLSLTMAQILDHNDDINNALMSASAAADMLAVLGVQRHNLPRAEFVELVRKLNENLTRIQDMVLEIRQKGRRSVSAEPENVDLVPVLESVRTHLMWRFPEVHIQLAVEGEASARVRGGVTTMRRVVENLVLNACEGNGQRGAARVDILTRIEPYSGRLEVLIRDDGPGFPPEKLRAPIEGLSTTKPNGTGLGLYTSECLIRASGGMLERTNRPTGGAQVRILLPREPG
jgi:signal transduction histidine kinase